MEEHDRHLIKNAQKGDTDAFRELIDRYGQRIYRIAYQTCGNAEDARDIAQEVFIRLYKKLNMFRHTSKFTTWLYRMTVNLSVDYLRKNSGRGTISLDDDVQPYVITDSGSLPDENAERSELKGIILKLTEYLTPYQRKVFVLRDLQDISTAGIADILECSVSTVRVHLAAARKQIRQELTKRYPNLAVLKAPGGD